MPKQSPVKQKLLITERALRDVISIRDYSEEEFGKRVAQKYLSGLESSINLIKESPSLLREEPGFHPWMKFYRYEKHLLVWDIQKTVITLLTIIHTSMDIPSRLEELEPNLKNEIELLHRKLQQSSK